MTIGLFKSSFDSAKKIYTAETILMWISASLMVVEAALKNHVCETFTQVIAISNCIIIIIFQVITCIRGCIQFKAEDLKRKDLFDNSFGTKISERRSRDYYSNDNIAIGFKKLGINNFESCFFTYRIMESDLPKEIIKMLIVLFVFVIVVFCGLQNILMLMIQITLPITIVTEGLEFCMTERRVENIYHEYRKLFEKKDSIRDVDILKLLVSYTATLQSGSLLLSDKTYNKLNDALSDEWEVIKSDLNISE